MRYSIDVLDNTKLKVAELTGMVTSQLHEKVNGMSVLTVETIDQRKWNSISPGTSFLRLNTLDGDNYQTFRVIEVTKARRKERPYVGITARHIIYDTTNEIFADSISCLNYTPAELANIVLAHSVYSAGTVEPAASVPFVRFEYESVLNCLYRICSLTGGELSLDEENGQIDILNRIGGSNGVIMRYGVNLKGVIRTVNMSSMINRIYGVGGGNPPLLLNGATESGGNSYVEDSDSVSLYGVYEGVYQEPTIEEAVNLLSTPAFDGEYTSGLCENWTIMGNPSLSKNTDSDYYLYGKASQHVQSSSDGDGIEQSVTVAPGTIYSLSASVIMVSGTVRVEITDGTSTYKRANAITGSGLATVRIENWKANNTSVTIQVYQEGSGTAEFYVDSVQIVEGSISKPFYKGKSADILWNHSTEYLEAHKNPAITYDVDLVDFYGDIRAKRENDKFVLGDTIRVIDNVLDLDIETRVMEREVDILHPWRVKIKLDNPSHSLEDIFTALTESQEKAIKYQRETLAESSKAAEVGSSRLGFSNLAFRFFGMITVSGWNSLNWNSGTLRVGEAYYSITSGSKTGLSESSTYYFYFDRTNPTTFGYTTLIDNAESEDRILVFAVTTTSNPDPCEIHPLGVIHA
ncbi:phage tail spike protein [Candidatus Latescibacterota bacterium]